MAVDLHTHSRASDGSDPPGRLVELAVSQGLTAMALTDHDTLEGFAEAEVAARGSGLELIPGTELSLEDDGGMHLVVLWLRPGPGPLQDSLQSLRIGRDRRNSLILEALAAHGVEITAEEVAIESGGGSVGRPHIAAVMMRKGYVTDIASAFELWLGRDRPGYVARPRLNPGKAIRLARESGAVPILAHPHTLGISRAEDMARLLHDLVDHGLVGLEAIYPSYHRHERDGYSDLARRFGLVPSGGSDYHGSYKPGIELGIGYGDLHVPDSVIHRLREFAVAP
jgi:predicted metal-dependent phosphoesterase TrpH